MLTDRYGLPLSTGSAAARDAYVEAADLALTFYPGAAEAYAFFLEHMLPNGAATEALVS